MPDRENLPEPPVNWQQLTGIGWFSKPAALMAKLDKIMARFDQAAGRTAARSAFGALIDGATRELGNYPPIERLQTDRLGRATETNRVSVAGFLIYVRSGWVRLTVFTRSEPS